MNHILQNLINWFAVKSKLVQVVAEPPLVKEREIWWASIGSNIGSEIEGKGRLYTRPVIVIRKLSKGLFLVAPTTSKQHVGSWYVQIDFAGSVSWVCLQQIRTIDYRRLSTKIAQLDESDFRTIKEAFRTLYY